MIQNYPCSPFGDN